MLIEPDWPAPDTVHAATSTRHGGVSSGVFDSLNLGTHVSDDPQRVAQNRQLLRSALQAPTEPRWLNQTHSTIVIDAATVGSSPPEADAAWTNQNDVVCTVMTADCMPLLMCSADGEHLAACHAGWRGLANGIIENTLDTFPQAAQDILIWLGPTIGPQAFEVGEDVVSAFTAWSAESHAAFVQTHEDKWLADLYSLAKLRLRAKGFENIYGGEFCTYSDSERFFSYRRDGQTGRMASLIWKSQAT